MNFDQYANNYRDIHTKNIEKISGTDSSYFGEYKIKEIRGHEKWNSVRILDLGCGDGMNASFFLKYFKGCEYHGIDVSEDSIIQSKKYKTDHTSFQVYDGKYIPFDDYTFDIILISCVLHHVPHDQHHALLCECKRVLKQNGRLYVFEHNPLNPITRHIVNDCPFDADAELVMCYKLKKLLSFIGFVNIKSFYQTSKQNTASSIGCG